MFQKIKLINIQTEYLSGVGKRNALAFIIIEVPIIIIVSTGSMFVASLTLVIVPVVLMRLSTSIIKLKNEITDKVEKLWHK